MNWVCDVVEAREPGDVALLELRSDGTRRAWSFGEIVGLTHEMQRRLGALGVRRGETVLILVGDRPEWVGALLACFRMGALALPFTEGSRTSELPRWLAAARPRAVVADERHVIALRGVAPRCPLLVVPDVTLGRPDPRAAVPAAAVLGPEDGCFLTFVRAPDGEPGAVVHVQRALVGLGLQAEHWLGLRPGDVVWCTEESGRNGMARSAFVGPWSRGAVPVLHDGPVDPVWHRELLARERVNVLCMSAGEYRRVARAATIPPLPDLRRLAVAGAAPEAWVLGRWRDATGLEIAGGFGQVETGRLTGVPPGARVRPGSLGRPLPGVRLWIDGGELVVDPTSVPTFFRGYRGRGAARRERPWRTGCRAYEDDGWLYPAAAPGDGAPSSGRRAGRATGAPAAGVRRDAGVPTDASRRGASPGEASVRPHAPTRP